MEQFHLNPQQQEAVDTIEGALLLLAGAGTGKTRVIVQRIENMIRHGISAENILAVTFTNKAAKEMRERVAKALPPNAPLPQACTFHSFCATVLRAHAKVIGYTRDFTLATEGYQLDLLRQLAVENHLVNDGIDPYSWLANISRAKSAMLEPDDLEDENLSLLYRRYDERLKLMNMMDFDDMLRNTLAIWEKSPKILEWYQNRYRYLMIDEYQDTNRIQLQIMVTLAGDRQNVCAVGDDDQSIYGWRGADQRNILDFETFFPKAKILRLEQNYRSTNTILKAANGVISHNGARREKNLWSNEGEGVKLLGVRCEDGEAEAAFVADRIYGAAASGSDSMFSHRRDWRKFAILYRTSGQSRLIEDALRKRHIPYEIIGSKSFYQRKEILDILSMLELAVNPQNDMSLLRVVNVPPRGAGDALLQKLEEHRSITHLSLMELLSHPKFQEVIPPETKSNLLHFQQAILRCGENAEQPGPIAPRVSRLLEDFQYVDKLIQMYKPRANALDRRDNVLEFLNSLQEYDYEHQEKGTLSDFLQTIALQDAGDRREKDKDVTENAVELMTIHAAKGLEFPVVFIVGTEQGLFPHQMAVDEGNLEEERRLCYVAMTRARKELLLTYADKRRYQGKITFRRPSLFLDEIPEEFIDFKTPAQLQTTTSPEQSASAFAEILARLEKNAAPK